MSDPILIFIDAADDAAAYPASRLYGMTVAGDGTVLMKFHSSIGSGGTDGSAADIITLTVTADTELAVFKGIAEKIEGAKRNAKNILSPSSLSASQLLINSHPSSSLQLYHIKTPRIEVSSL